jgi:hypothetical protein
VARFAFDRKVHVDTPPVAERHPKIGPEGEDPRRRRDAQIVEDPPRSVVTALALGVDGQPDGLIEVFRQGAQGRQGRGQRALVLARALTEDVCLHEPVPSVTTVPDLPASIRFACWETM